MKVDWRTTAFSPHRNAQFSQVIKCVLCHNDTRLTLFTDNALTQQIKLMFPPTPHTHLLARMLTEFDSTFNQIMS